LEEREGKKMKNKGVRRIKGYLFEREIRLEEKWFKEKKKIKTIPKGLISLKSIKSHMCLSHVLGHLSAY
jgi:hypothetical protein